MTVPTLKVHDHLGDRILVSRNAARLLVEPLRGTTDLSAASGCGDRTVTVDFAGVDGMAPSFLDELVGVMQATLGPSVRIRFVNQPARMSLKFQAVARGRGLKVSELTPGEWRFDPVPTPSSDPKAL